MTTSLDPGTTLCSFGADANTSSTTKYITVEGDIFRVFQDGIDGNTSILGIAQDEFHSSKRQMKT
jgi:hypothetical protein